VLDYGLLPPEINSLRMYTGPGSSSLVAASTGWGELATELHAVSAGFTSVISTLTSGPWLGPASTALLTAVTPYVGWLQSSATQAETAASQAAAAVSAHETAFSMTVPPPVVTANRSLLATLVATNFLGQNTPAIATTEAEYFEFWAQDAAAMYGYLTSSLSAIQLPDFTEPPEVADPSGTAKQSAAVSKAAADTTTNPVHDAVTKVLAQLDVYHDPVAQYTSDFTWTKVDGYITKYTALDDLVAGYQKYISPYINSLAASIQSSQSFGQVTNGLVAMATFSKGAAPAVKALEGAASAAGAAASNAGANLGAAAGGLGKALPLGALSVPTSWAPVSAVTNPAIGALNATVVPAAAEGVGGLPMAPLGGFGGGRYGGRILPTYGFKPSIMARPPAAG
jgi:PPE-repeat protein